MYKARDAGEHVGVSHKACVQSAKDNRIITESFRASLSTQKSSRQRRPSLLESGLTTRRHGSGTQTLGLVEYVESYANNVTTYWFDRLGCVGDGART